MTNMFGPMKIKSLLDPTLKSLTSFQLTNNKNEEYSGVVAQVLKDNKLEKISFQSDHSLFGAFSIGIFLTAKNEEIVIARIKEQILEMLRKGDLTLRLYNFKNDRKLLTDFLNKPYHSDYEKYVYDLVSLAFNLKVVICTVPLYSSNLHESYYTNKKDRTLKIFKNENGGYEALFEEGYYQKATMCRSFINESIDIVLRIKKREEEAANSDDKKEDGSSPYDGKRKRNRRSLSDSNFERFFACAREDLGGAGSSSYFNHTSDSNNSNDNEKYHQWEKEFNYFLMKDQKDELSTEIERKKIPDVGRNLVDLFKQEVPTHHIFDPNGTSKPIVSTEGDLNKALFSPPPIAVESIEITQTPKPKTEFEPTQIIDNYGNINQHQSQPHPQLINQTQSPIPHHNHNHMTSVNNPMNLDINSNLSSAVQQRMMNPATMAQMNEAQLMAQINRAQNPQAMHPNMQNMNMNFDLKMNMFANNFDNSSSYALPFSLSQMGFQTRQQNMMQQQPVNGMDPNLPKKKPIILDQTNVRYDGRLKFFDEAKGYGFIIMEDDGSDIFCHYDDFFKAGIDLNILRGAKDGRQIKLSFCCLSYIGRHNKSRKAVDLKLMGFT